MFKLRSTIAIVIVEVLNSCQLLTEVFIKVEFVLDKNSKKNIVPSHKPRQMKLESAIDSFDCSCDKLPSFQQRDSRARLPHSSSSSILLFHPN